MSQRFYPSPDFSMKRHLELEDAWDDSHIGIRNMTGEPDLLGVMSNHGPFTRAYGNDLASSTDTSSACVGG